MIKDLKSVIVIEANSASKETVDKVVTRLRHGQPPRYSSVHGSLEGVGGLKTNEAYHSKADALLIPEMYFFLKIYLRPFL